MDWTTIFLSIPPSDDSQFWTRMEARNCARLGLPARTTFRFEAYSGAWEFFCFHGDLGRCRGAVRSVNRKFVLRTVLPIGEWNVRNKPPPHVCHGAEATSPKIEELRIGIDSNRSAWTIVEQQQRRRKDEGRTKEQGTGMMNDQLCAAEKLKEEGRRRVHPL